MDLEGNEANSIGFLLHASRSAALFPFDWSIKSALPLFQPITESNFKSQAVCPCTACCKEFPIHFGKVRLRERELVILALVLLRDPLIAAFCRWPFDPSLLTPWTSCYQPKQTGAKIRKQTVHCFDSFFVDILSIFVVCFLTSYLGHSLNFNMTTSR